jgi:hypothetical protein
MSVELATDHRKVAACPRSIETGSTEKLTILAAPAVGSGVFTGAGAGLGGGGGAGTGFFPHPAAPINNVMVNTAALSVLEFIRIFTRPFWLALFLPYVLI